MAPDPSSQGACTIGGNVATNSGGPHTLKYGVTVNHVLGVEAVLADGSVVRLGGPAEDPVGLDLVGAVVGSEGTLAIVTKVWVRLTRNPQGHRTMLGIFESVDDATTAISEIIGAGIVPAALEMMDQGILVAVEAAFQYGFSAGCTGNFAHRGRWASKPDSTNSVTASSKCASGVARGKCAWPAMNKSGSSSGNAASRPSARSAV